ALKTHFRRERFARECLLDLNGRRAANIQDWLRETPNKPSIKTCRLFLARLPLWSSVERTPTRLAANRPDHAPLLVLAVRIARRRGVGVSFHRSQQHLQEGAPSKLSCEIDTRHPRNEGARSHGHPNAQHNFRVRWVELRSATAGELPKSQKSRCSWAR